MVEPRDVFFFYNSAVGDLGNLLRKYAEEPIARVPGRVVNAFGVSINPKFFPGVLDGKEGEIDPLPIPANFHADMAEFGAALCAVEAAEEVFTVVELGCGWGCWLNITGAAARRKGLNVRLVGVEGDPGHVKFAHESLCENGFDSNQFVIHHGIAHAESGIALFPLQQKSGQRWGLEPLFGVDEAEAERLVRAGTYAQLPQVALSTLLPADRQRIDLLHIDIQGGEIPLIPDSIEFLSDKVAMILIGTHSRQIEGELFGCLSAAGWRLDVERPAILGLIPEIHTLVDGVQLWRNPKYIEQPVSSQGVVPRDGSISVANCPPLVRVNEVFSVRVTVTNGAPIVWRSNGSLPVSLSYHWKTEELETVVYDGIRTPFSAGHLGRGERVIQEMRVQAPPSPGCYKLHLTLVQDGVRWFDNCEFQTAVVQVKVVL